MYNKIEKASDTKIFDDWKSDNEYYYLYRKGKLVLKDIKQLPILESFIDKEKIDFINIERDPTNYIFSFETDGSFTAKNALIESAKILENKYSELGKLLQKPK